MTKREKNLPEAPMDQVRDLLFGAQLKEMETRFQRQEERLQREIGDARDSFKSRIDSLENFMKSEIASLLHRLKEEQSERESEQKAEQRERAETLRAEQKERSEAIDQIGKELALLSESFERKLAKVAGTLDNAERELRELLLSESNSLKASIDEKYADALAVLEKTASQIRNDMVYRSTLSGLFSDVAVKLSQSWIPDYSQIFSVPEGENEPEAGKTSSTADAE